MGRLLSRSTFDERTPEQRAEIAAHFGRCDACRDRWQGDVTTREIGDFVKAQRKDADVKGRVLEEIQRRAAKPGAKGGKVLKQLAGFEILGRLGKGGMGTVLKARQVSMERFVALKILPRRLAQDPAFVQRFYREARSAAKLRHANIVQAHDVGEDQGYHYFAMEYVDGETLDAILLRDGPLDQGRALAYMKQVCSALACAHDAGIIHRDTSPRTLC
ncbi:MAG: serine/threonine protein kinase [Candidatus Brocadiae bacterium]|nr:serine/threonine protein kinase [Candidatus Brocadiia bacterium]